MNGAWGVEKGGGSADTTDKENSNLPWEDKRRGRRGRMRNAEDV
jgi:hypothetical protein